jgi:hypothetical protein
MNFTDRLQVILDWVGSHSKRLSRTGYEAKNHLAGGSIYFSEAAGCASQPSYADEGLTQPSQNPVPLDLQGKLNHPVYLKPDSKYRIQVHDSDDAVLFTEDHIQT